MKIVIMTLCLLLGLVGLAYGDGQKEPTYPPYCWQQPTDSDLWYPCGSEEAKIAHCKSLMETAMQRVDPYLLFLETGVKIQTPEEQEQFKSALYAWNRIKHECWKEYEAERQQSQHYH